MQPADFRLIHPFYIVSYPNEDAKAHVARRERGHCADPNVEVTKDENKNANVTTPLLINTYYHNSP